jgi:ATP-binding cassette, subfamily G (WHITE), member 2, PDR
MVVLLFCDEPTSGLDSQAAWGVVQFLRKLADAGQSILCTIHQPSAVLFEQFDRLLLLQKGGKTVYFGDTGEGSQILINYFEKNGAGTCPPDANPAEYILEQIGAGATATANKNWHDVWLASPERDAAANEIEEFHTRLSQVKSAADNTQDSGAFAMPFATQFKAVTIRTFQHYYRSPTYIGGKLVLSVLSALFIGFTFYMEDDSVQGFQNKLFAVFFTVRGVHDLTDGRQRQAQL